MKAAARALPANVPVRIRDQETISEVRGLINDRIEGRLPEGPGIEISLLSNSDPDAPADLAPSPPGERVFQIDLYVDNRHIRFIVSTLGRAGSELIGYTSDELRKGETQLRKVIATARREGRVSADSLGALWDCEFMLGAPADSPERWQPISPTDEIIAHAIFWPEGGK